MFEMRSGAKLDTLMERLCPQCEERTTERRCPRDGYATVPAKLYGGAHDLLIGKVFEERYRVDALIGKGGFGAVYRAMQLAVDRPVALKVLRREIRGDLEQVRRFQYEARAASRLIDPHVLRIFDFGQAEDGTLYLVTELLEGEPLSRRLKRVGALPVEAAVSILCQALRGLAEAHDGGLVHRDLKPDNLFLRQGRAGEELVKILDFGVVKFTADADPLESLTQSGTVLGTPAYMAPEQARGVRVDTRSDLYAMGIILYQMLSGRRPFKGSTPMEVLLDHIRTVPPRVEVVSKQAIPPELGELVHRCLDKDPRKRPESADALRTGLERVLGQLAERRDLDPPIRPGGCAPGGATQPTSESDLVSLRDTASMATPVVRTGPHAPTPTQTARSPAAQAGGRRRLLALVVGLALAIPVVLAVDRNFDQGGHADAEQENGGLGSDETAAEVNAPVAPAPRASSARGAGANVSSSASAAHRRSGRGTISPSLRAERRERPGVWGLRSHPPRRPPHARPDGGGVDFGEPRCRRGHRWGGGPGTRRKRVRNGR